MAAIYRYEIDAIDKDTGKIWPDTGFVAADSFSEAVEEIASFVGGNESLTSVNLYEIINPIDDAGINTILEETRDSKYSR